MRRTKPNLYDRTQPRRLANKTTLLATVLLLALHLWARIGKLVLMVSSHSLPSSKALLHQGSLSWPRAPVKGVLKVTTRTNCQHLAVTSSVTMDKQLITLCHFRKIRRYLIDVGLKKTRSLGTIRKVQQPPRQLEGLHQRTIHFCHSLQAVHSRPTAIRWVTSPQAEATQSVDRPRTEVRKGLTCTAEIMSPQAPPVT